VQEWKLENANNEASGEEDKNTEKKKKYLREKGILSLIVNFFCIPGTVEEFAELSLSIWCGFRRRLPRPRFPPPHRVHHPSLPLLCLTRDGIIGG
jgi:hypothetical protein